MRHFLRAAPRIALVCAIVLLCGAYSCVGPVGEVGYAPGYGYVVKVRKLPVYFSLNDAEDNYYFWFKTEQEAWDFINLRRDNPPMFEVRMRELRSNKQGTMDDEDNYEDEFEKISRLIRPLPPPPNLNETEIPLAAPELPQPIPSTPQ